MLQPPLDKDEPMPITMDSEIDAAEFHASDRQCSHDIKTYVNPLAGLYVVRVTYCCLRRTSRPVTKQAALKAAAVLKKSEGPNCRVEVLPAIGNWREPERVEP